MMTRRRRTRPAWSLTELLVVIAILTVIIALSLSAIMRIRDASYRTSCLDNMRQLGIAVNSYHSVQDALPPYATGLKGGEIFGNWFLYLLPYVDEGATYRELMGDASGSNFTTAAP